jgi:hypothetical protein
LYRFLGSFPRTLKTWLVPGDMPSNGCLVSLLLVVLTSPVSLPAEQNLAHSNPPYEFATNTSSEFPLSYIYGSVVENNVIRDRKGGYATNIQFQPRYASEVFTENVLFCGNRAAVFAVTNGPIVVTYGRIAHKLVNKVPCFDLLSVDHVESKDERTVTAK